MISYAQMPQHEFDCKLRACKTSKEVQQLINAIRSEAASVREARDAKLRVIIQGNNSVRNVMELTRLNINLTRLNGRDGDATIRLRIVTLQGC